ncbi:MAG TPA: lipocalin-like domain-containing protein [Deltaproteobacteria bacterium]|jgi:hypothetical protein|nr:lipocalin-like domain-containing protein [Deltaproteobacteria bacterium]HIJ75834.1 lipocalin-like domain-containing protein [Deltaproteobacteria bacterium]
MISGEAISIIAGFSLVLLMSPAGIAAAKQLYGTWRLVSCKRTFAATGETKDIFGKSPHGFIIFGRDGRMLVLLAGDRRPKPPDPDKVTDQDRIDLFKTMLAYGGKYTFDGKTLKTRVDISWNENWTGTEQARIVKFEGNRLILSTIPSIGSKDGKLESVVLTWERIQ